MNGWILHIVNLNREGSAILGATLSIFIAQNRNKTAVYVLTLFPLILLVYTCESFNIIVIDVVLFY